MKSRYLTSLFASTAIAIILCGGQVAAEDAAKVPLPMPAEDTATSMAAPASSVAPHADEHQDGAEAATTLADAPKAADPSATDIAATNSAADKPSVDAPPTAKPNYDPSPTEAPPVAADISAPAVANSEADSRVPAMATTVTMPATTPEATTSVVQPVVETAPPMVAAEAATPETPAVAPALPPAIVARGPSAEALTSAIEAAAKTLAETRGTADERKDRAAVLAFYAKRANAPLFVAPEGLAAKGREAFDRFGRAGEDGLDPTAYSVGKPPVEASADNLAATEMAIAMSALRYARHATSGRFDPLRLSELATAKPPQIDPMAVLADLASASDVSAALEAYNPPQAGYRQLKAKLADFGPDAPLQAPVAQVPTGPMLKPGQKDARVAALRERLGVHTSANDAEFYDPSLVEAVKAFQRERGITPTGLVGPQTISALNEHGTATDVRAADIIANMERWRWLPRDLGTLHVLVNIPDYRLQVVRDGAVIHRTRVITGKATNQTPLFSSTMTHVIVNPYWNVPVSILKKEMLGKIQETAGAYLDRGNYEVVVGSRTVASNQVDWASVNPAKVRVRQRPGDGNALGHVKFMFDNEHSVYLHDTSSRGLFQQSYRALSHGCVRVNEPFAFADAIFSEEPTGLDGSKLKGMVGGDERWIYLKRKLDIHLAYFTVFVADDGKLESRPDVYGHNARTKLLLGL